MRRVCMAGIKRLVAASILAGLILTATAGSTAAAGGAEILACWGNTCPPGGEEQSE